MLPLVGVLTHFISYAYAILALQVQLSQNPWGYGGGAPQQLITNYLGILEKFFRFDLGMMPGGTVSIFNAISQACVNSLGLLLLAIALSLVIGLSLGFAAVKVNPTSIASWLAPVSTIGLATPGFFIGTLFIVANIYYLLMFGKNAIQPLPLSGFGWDEHLILPVIALSIRPAAHIAQTLATLLTGEFHKQYIVASRSIGNTWNRIRKKHALRNVLAPVIISISSAFRFLVAELILVEWVFIWPGLGRLLALTLIPPNTSSIGGFGSQPIYFLYPELLASVITIFAITFFVIDSISSGLSLWVDPRVRKGTEREFHG